MPLISHRRDPAGIEKPIFYEVADSTDIIDWLVKTYGSQDALCGDLACSFVLNGKEIFRTDHENKDESLINMSISNNDHLMIINRPGDPLSTTAIITIVIAAVSVAASVYMYMNMPELGNTESASSSPNGKLSAGSNSFRPYEGIPEIFGHAIAYPDFIQPSYYYYENNIKKQIGLFCLTAGVAEIDAVNVGSTNIESIAESTATFYEPSETVPQEFLSIHTQSTEIDGQVLIAPNDDSIVKSNQSVVVVGLGSTTEISVDDSDYDDSTFIFDTDLDVGKYIYIRSKLIVDEQIVVDDEGFESIEYTYERFDGVFEILSITSTSSPATFIVDYASDIDGYTTSATVGRGDEQGVIGEGTSGELDDYYVGWYELAGDSTEEVWINWTMPYGLRTAKGNRATMQVKFDIQSIVDDVWTGNIWSKTVSLTKNTTDGQYNTVKFTKDNTSGMPTSKFLVRAKRLTNILSSTGAALEQVQLESASSVTPYYNSNFGDATVMLVERKATLYSADQSSKKINVEYTRQLPTYNRDTGVYDEADLVATNSFADAAAYTLITKGNETVDTVDLDELYAIYDGLNDPELGEFSYTFDDADLSKGERVDNICKVARVISFHDGIKWRFSRDEIKPIRSALFNRRSTFGNQSQQTWQPQRSDDSDSIRIIYVDPDSNTEAYVDRSFDTDTGEIIEDEVGYNLKEITLAGCRNVTQATNRADLEIRRLAYQRRSVTETTYRDAITIDLLDRVGWVDVNDIDTFDGEIMAIDGDVYDTTERFEPIDGESYAVFITDNEGYPSNTVTCTARDDTEFGFIATGISDAYVASGDQQIGSRYFIANATDLEASNFTLTSRTPQNDGTVTVELAEYRVEMYEKDGAGAAKEMPQIPTGLTALDFATSGNDAESTLTFSTDGLINLNGTLTSWYSGGQITDIGSFFEIKATLKSGVAIGTFNEWLTISSDLNWSIAEINDDSTNSAVVTFAIRQIDYTTNADSNDITITAIVGADVALPAIITVSDTNISQPTSSISFNYDGTYTGSDGTSGTYTTTSNGIGEFYEIKATSTMQEDFPIVGTTLMGVLTGDVSGDDFEEWHTLDASGAGWSLTALSESETATFYVTVRRIADNSDADTCIVTLNSFIG